MKLYNWWSVALANYAQGDIIAIGANIEEARANARVLFDPWIREHRGWWFDVKTGEITDEDDQISYNDLLAIFEADIAEEPKEITSAILIRGSE